MWLFEEIRIFGLPDILTFESNIIIISLIKLFSPTVNYAKPPLNLLNML